MKHLKLFEEFKPNDNLPSESEKVWKSATTIKFKTKKEADERKKLMKDPNRTDKTQYRNIQVVKIDGDALNKGYLVKFEYCKE